MKMRIVFFSMLAVALTVLAVPHAAQAGTLQTRAVADVAAWGGDWQGNAALDWAEANAAGTWYAWGGTGPGSYDCSGLVMEAFGHGAGIWLPHSTYSMLASPRLHQVPLSQVRRGDLVFYGSGHVEIATAWHGMSFGAHTWGQRVGWIAWGPYWAPTMAFRVY